MKLKILFSEKFTVLGVMDGDECPAEVFLNSGEADTLGSRAGLGIFLKHLAENGWERTPVAWYGDANKVGGIYEFKKGRLRLFFFKGQGNHITVCTGGVIKKTQKVDKLAVKRAIDYSKQYSQAVKDKTIELVEKNED